MQSNDELEMQNFSSDISIDMNREFVYWNYPLLRAENNPAYGVEDSADVVFMPVDIDMLCYVLMSKGTHLILFGGVWSEATQSVIAQINDCARKHGVDTVYLFDFSADGTEAASIKQDITAHEDYIGPGKKKANPFAVYNYIYGEIVTRHLTNLNDWVAEKIGEGSDITYLDLYQNAITVPNLTEPFLFLYNRENRVDHSECGREDEFFPIVWAAELGKAENGTVAELEEKIFRHIGEEGCDITPYTNADYMYDAFSISNRGHAPKTENAFEKGEEIALTKMCFQVFRWTMQQSGSYVFMIGGPWCANTQAAVATVNDYAVANHARAYLFDSRLDGKHPFDFWKRPRVNELTMTCPPMKKYFVELWEERLPGAPIVSSINPFLPYYRPVTLDYTDDSGKVHTVLTVGVPYVFSYNKDHRDARGHRVPLLASYHGSGELINYSENFIYHDPTYREFKAGIYRVFYFYMTEKGETPMDTSVDRTAPIVPGEFPEHIENVAYHKHHEWYRDPDADVQTSKAEVGCC